MRNRQGKKRCKAKTFPNKTTAVEQSKPQRKKNTTDTKQPQRMLPLIPWFLGKLSS